MTNFALITEGITDQAVLEYILDGLTGGNSRITQSNPRKDCTDNNGIAQGGWENVFDFLKSTDIIKAIDNNDYVVIQIDTDVGEHPNFGLSLREKTIPIIVKECIEKLKSSLHPEFPPSELERLLFAIPVLSTECWIFSLHNENHTHTEKTINNCENRLKRYLKRKDINLVKEYNFYKELCRDFRKLKNIETVAQRTPCFQLFVNQVKAVCQSS